MRTLDEILRDAARDLALLAQSSLLGFHNKIEFTKCSKLLNELVKEFDTTDLVTIK